MYVVYRTGFCDNERALNYLFYTKDIVYKMQIEVMLFAVVGDFFYPGLGFHIYLIPSPLKKSKLKKTKQKQKGTSVFIALVLKCRTMSSPRETYLKLMPRVNIVGGYKLHL